MLGAGNNVRSYVKCTVSYTKMYGGGYTNVRWGNVKMCGGLRRVVLKCTTGERSLSVKMYAGYEDILCGYITFPVQSK